MMFCSPQLCSFPFNVRNHIFFLASIMPLSTGSSLESSDKPAPAAQRKENGSAYTASHLERCFITNSLKLCMCALSLSSAQA
jgi:hypothetical protein